jgi:hypothetical protein
MEDVVAMALQLQSGEEAYVLTWGRLQHAVDPLPLAYIVLKHAGRFSLSTVVTGVRLCESLREAVIAPRFFECLVAIGREQIPYGQDYASWRRGKLALMESGRDLWFAGVAEVAEQLPPHLRATELYEPPATRHDPPPPFAAPLPAKMQYWATDALACHFWVWAGSAWEPTTPEVTAELERRHSRHHMESIDDHHIVCRECGVTMSVVPASEEP